MELTKKTIETAREENYGKYAYSRTMGVLRRWYATAVEAHNEEEAAEAARGLRNAILDETDSMMVSDRPNVDEEAWKTYRQELRDITLQSGFPLDIRWPEKPE